MDITTLAAESGLVCFAEREKERLFSFDKFTSADIFSSQASPAASVFGEKKVAFVRSGDLASLRVW